MNILTRIKSAFAAGALGVALLAPCSAQVTQVKPEEGSKHFAAVAKHLELGGLYFSYMDVDGDLAALGKAVDRFLTVVRKETPDIPQDLSAAKIIDALGLTSVKAIGMSTRSLGNDLYHNRALLYMPDGPKGLMRLAGGKPAPLQIASWAPADTGAAIQFDLHLSTLLETAESVLKAAGQEEALGPYRIALAMPVPGLKMNIGELVGKLDTRAMIAMRMDESKRLTVPGSPFDFPAMQIMVALDDVDFLMEPLIAASETNDDIVVEKGEDFTIVRMNAPLPGDLSFFKPGIYHDKKTKRIILTSHLDMAKEAGKGKLLGDSESFKKATAGLPTEANGLTYATPEFAKAFFAWYKEVIEASSKIGGNNAMQTEMINVLWDILQSVPSGPIATVYSNVPEGMLFMSNTNSTHKWTMMQASLIPVAVAVGAVAGYEATMSRERAMRDMRTERDRVRKKIEEPEAPDKAVKNNLQQIAFSAQTWFIDHPGDKEVTYETLVKNELLFELDPVGGEAYKGLTLKRTGGEISVKLKGGGSISHKYSAVSD